MDQVDPDGKLREGDPMNDPNPAAFARPPSGRNKNCLIGVKQYVSSLSTPSLIENKMVKLSIAYAPLTR